MLSQAVLVCCVLIALKPSFGYFLPRGNSNPKSADVSWQVVPLPNHHILNVEIVQPDGNTVFEQLGIDSGEDEETTMAEQPTTITIETQEELDDEDMKDDLQVSPIKSNDYRYKCDWRRLYKMYLQKQKKINKARYTRMKEKEIRNAFKIVCENPEDVIRFLLRMD